MLWLWLLLFTFALIMAQIFLYLFTLLSKGKLKRDYNEFSDVLISAALLPIITYPTRFEGNKASLLDLICCSNITTLLLKLYFPTLQGVIFPVDVWALSTENCQIDRKQPWNLSLNEEYCRKSHLFLPIMEIQCMNVS